MRFNFGNAVLVLLAIPGEIVRAVVRGLRGSRG